MILYNEERPHLFDDMVGQEYIVNSLRNQSKNDDWFPVYIFAGQFGSGKTTMARIIALAVNCLHKDENGNPCLECEHCKAILEGNTTDIIEIDGASNNGVDDVRRIKEGLGYMPTSLTYKIYIIDEVHMLSKAAFNALLKPLEEPPAYVKFILATTEPNAIPVTVRSRAGVYTFEQIPFDLINNHLVSLATKYSMDISDNALGLVAKYSEGSMRNALKFLQQVVTGCKKRVEAIDVQNILGITDVSYLFALYATILKSEAADCIAIIEQAAGRGKDMYIMISDLLDIVTDSVVALSTSIDKIHNTEQYMENLSKIIQIAKLEQVFQIADGLMSIRVELRKCYSKSTVCVGIIRIIQSANKESILERVKMLEKAIESGTFQITSETSLPKEEKMEISESIPENENVKSTHSAEGEKKHDDGMAAGEQDSIPDDIVSQTFEQSEASVGFIPVESNVFEQTETDPINHEIQKDNLSEQTNSDESLPVTKTDDEVPWKTDEKEIIQDVAAAVHEPEKEDLTQSETDEEFDIFEFLDEFSFVDLGNSNSVKDVKESDGAKDSSSNDESLSKQRRLEEMLRMAAVDNEIFNTAIVGCKKVMRNGILVLLTPLRPVHDIIQKYLEVASLDEIEIEFDAKVSLN